MFIAGVFLMLSVAFCLAIFKRIKKIESGVKDGSDQKVKKLK
jgi:hypothetical protein